MKQKSDTLSLVGLILGVIGLVISFVPCIGLIGTPIAIIGLILAIIGLVRDIETGASKNIAISGIICSLLTFAVAIYGIFSLVDKASFKVETCEEAIHKFEEALLVIEEISHMDESDGDFSILTKTINATSILATIDEKVKKLGCLSDPNFKVKYEALQARREKID